MTPAQALLSYCQNHKLLFGFAESCTGGALSAAITQIPGASDCFIGAYITYSNAMKQQCLRVKDETLKQHGAVSAETVEEMALGTLRSLNVDFTIAISGIAGPSGATPDKPIGTVYLGFACLEKVEVVRLQLSGDRPQIIEQSCHEALTQGLAFAKQHL